MKQRLFSPAFSMIELVFIIVILGILGSVALPTFTRERGAACEAKLRGEIAALRSEISITRSKNFLINQATVTVLPNDSVTALLSVSTQGTPSCGWSKNNNTYTAHAERQTVPFELNATSFDCPPSTGPVTSQELCKRLTNRQ